LAGLREPALRADISFRRSNGMPSLFRANLRGRKTVFADERGNGQRRDATKGPFESVAIKVGREPTTCYSCSMTQPESLAPR
ncbi:hypothetical protein, partial [Faecalibacillus intestinalis]|uniref:hypothetical protein n=1 Tax=Faecalibacillus intestinalis TaxID=1982626 RepID=UPI001EDE72A3